MPTKTINFTKKTIESLQPQKDDKRHYYRDMKIGYLEVQITPKGTKSFQVYRRIAGNSGATRVTIGRFPDISVEEARKKAQKFNAQMANGINPNAQRRLSLERNKGRKTILEICHDNLEAKTAGKNLTRGKRKLSESMLYRYKHLTSIIEQKHGFASRFADEIKRYDAHIFLDKYSSTPAMAQQLIGWLSNSYDYAMRRGVDQIEFNPFHNAEKQYRLPDSDELSRHTDEEIIKIIEYLNDAESGLLGRSINPYWILFVRFLILNGSRPNEPLTIRRSWIRNVQVPETDKTQMAIIHGDTKTGQKIIYISDPLYAEIEKTPSLSGNDYLLPSRKSASSHMVNYKEEFKKMRQVTGVDKEPYGIRRWFARTAQKAFDGNAKQTQELQGWSDESMVNRYAGNDEELVDMVISRNAPLCTHVSNHIQDILTNK